MCVFSEAGGAADSARGGDAVFFLGDARDAAGWSPQEAGRVPWVTLLSAGGWTRGSFPPALPCGPG